MGLDGRHRDVEDRGDLLGGLALGDELQTSRSRALSGLSGPAEAGPPRSAWSTTLPAIAGLR